MVFRVKLQRLNSIYAGLDFASLLVWVNAWICLAAASIY